MGVLTHRSDAEAWKHFDRMHDSSAIKPRNVQLGLFDNGFSPYLNAARPSSVCPIVVYVYNLPPHLCMMWLYMLLSSVIQGPHNPKKLQPLFDELKNL